MIIIFLLQSVMKTQMADDDDDEDHGGLVKKIMETKKEYEQPRKTEIVSFIAYWVKNSEDIYKWFYYVSHKIGFYIKKTKKKQKKKKQFVCWNFPDNDFLNEYWRS